MINYKNFKSSASGRTKIIKPAIIVNNPGYSPRERKLLEFAFDIIYSCNPANKSRHVTLLVSGADFIVCYGLNNEHKTDPKATAYYGNKIHAEWAAIKRFNNLFYKQSFKKITLFNIRITRQNTVVNSRPCKKCIKLLREKTFRNIYYTNERGEFVCMEK